MPRRLPPLPRDLAAHLHPATQRALVVATDEARRLGTGYVGTEHVLLGLLTDPEPGLRLLLGAGAPNPDTVRTELQRLVSREGDPGSTPTPLPTSQVREALSHAIAAAGERGDPAATPADLLLGLIRQPAAIATLILRQHGIRYRSLLHRLRQSF